MQHQHDGPRAPPEVPHEIWSLVGDFLPDMSQRGRLRRVCRAARSAELLLPFDKSGFMGAWHMVHADAFVCAVASSLRHGKNASLRELDLRSNRLSDAGGLALGAALGATPSPALQVIDLRDNRLGNAGACALGEALGGNCALRVLRLGSNAIADDGAIAIGTALATNSRGSLEGLDLAANDLGNGAALALASALREAAARTLHELDLSWNHVGSPGAIALSEALVGGACGLRELRLTSNLEIDSAGWLALRKAKASAHKAAPRLPLRIFGRNGTLLRTYSERDAEKEAEKEASTAASGLGAVPGARPRVRAAPVRPEIRRVRLRLQMEPHLGMGAAVQTLPGSGAETERDLARRISNARRQELLREPRSCEHCGATWPAGSITYNSYQSYRSRCVRHGALCRLRPSYQAKGMALPDLAE